jgi:ADP-ribosylglycohydrolase/protein-tyrosine phosphatase
MGARTGRAEGGVPDLTRLKAAHEPQPGVDLVGAGVVASATGAVERWDWVSETMAARLVGGVWGHLVGDAVGVPYESRAAVARAEVRFGASGAHGQPPGTWSDDGGLMLALLDSLTAEGVGFDVEHQGRRFVAWKTRGAYTPDGDGRFDIGGTTRVALAAIESGVAAADAGPVGIGDNGNGSLMRILPVALVGRGLSDQELMDRARRASRVTHGHPRAQVACSLYVLVAARLLAGERDRVRALDEAVDAHRVHDAGEPAMVEALDHLLGWTERAGRGVVWDSFWSAWDVFANANSYRATIERAVAYGHDTDTTAAIAGGLAGIYWGIGGIPGEWLAGMRGREVVGPLVDRVLVADGWRTSRSDPIRVDWVDLSSVPRLRGVADAGGRLGMTFLPGKHDASDTRRGPHWRDLRADASRLRRELGVDTLLVLVEDHELAAAGVADIADAMAGKGIELLRFPIRDMGVPADHRGLRRTLDHVLHRLRAGSTVVAACRGGLGRTGTIVACLLRDGGLDAEAAVALTRGSRHGTIETPAQESFVAGWSR